MNPTDHILTQLELTNNPGAIPNTYTNFGAVPTPIFIQRPAGFPHLPPNAAQDVDLANLGSSLNESRLALAMEMARLDVERMKFVEPPITITRVEKESPLTRDSANLPESGHKRGRVVEKQPIVKNGKGKGVTYSKPLTSKPKSAYSGAETGHYSMQQVSAHQSIAKSAEEIGKARCEIAECVRWMALKASQNPGPQFSRELDEEKKMETRVNQQTIRCARNLYSLQQQIRQIQTDVDKLNCDDQIVDVKQLHPSDPKLGHANSVMNKLVSVHKNVAKIAKDVATVSREGYGIEKQFSRTYSELSHLIRQLSLLNDQLGIDNVECHAEILDGLSVGEIVSENSRKTDENITKKLKIQLTTAAVGGSKVERSPPMSPDREQTLRAGILALGIDKILEQEKPKPTTTKTEPPVSGVKKKQTANAKNTKRNVIYTTSRSKLPPKVTKNVKSNILQSTVASQLKSVNADMLIRNPISDFNSANSSMNKPKPKSSSPVHIRPNESLDRLRESIDQSTILSSSRNQSLSPARGGKTKLGKPCGSPVNRPKTSKSPNSEDRIGLATHEQAENELKSYLKETNEMISQMKHERQATQRLFDSKKSLTPEAYGDIREICRMKLQKYASEDKDARAVMVQLKNMSDPTFRYLVKECSFGFKTFDYEKIADRVLDYLVEQRLEQAEIWKLKNDRNAKVLDRVDLEPKSTMNSKAYETVQEMLRRLDRIEQMENDISQRLNADAFSLRAFDTPGFAFGSKDNSQVPFKYVHFRDYPSVIETTPRSARNSTLGDLIVVNKGKDRFDQVGIKDLRDEIADDSTLMVGPTEIAIDQNLLTAVENEVKLTQRQLAEAFDVDLNKVSPSSVLDQVTNEILAECLEGVMNEFSNACDGFAQEIYASEFKPSAE